MVIKMQLTALIYSVEGESFFTVILDGRKRFFYLQKHLVKNFSKYLTKGCYVTFDYQEKQTKNRGILSNKVNHFIEISFSKNLRTKKTYYNLEVIRDGIKGLVKSMDSIFFIDFEMNMQDYVAINGFEPEIIEAGLVVTNGAGAIYDIKHWYIKPTKFKTITRRTMKFLHYTKAELNQAIDFKVFYNELKALVEKYNPYVVVWGKSDITQLKKTCEINKCPELKLHFVNLLQLHTNYDNLKDSPGLFSMWETYNGTKLPEQTHNSLEDATVTKEVFFNFKDKILK